MMSHLVRKPSPYTKEEKKEIVKDFYKPKSKPMGIVPYIQTMNRLYGSDGGAVTAPHGTEPDYIPPREMEDIKRTLNVSEMVQKPKKKIIKKTLIVEKPKPKYLNGNVIDITPLIDDEWWKLLDIEPPKEEEVLLRVPKRKLKGLASLLNVG